MSTISDHLRAKYAVAPPPGAPRSVDLADLAALLDVAEAAQRVDQEWIERGDGGCATKLRLDLHVALGKLPQKGSE